MDIKQLAASAIETIIKIAVAVFLISFVYETAVKAYDYGYRVFAEDPVTVGDGRTISIAVEPDDSVRDIGKNLEEKGLIRDANLFFVQEMLSEYHGKIQPGIYDLNTSMKSSEMLEIMSEESAEGEEENKGSTDNAPVEDAGEEGTEDASAPEEGGEEAEGDNAAENGEDGAAGSETGETGGEGE